MAQRICYTRPDGGLSIIIPSGELSIEELIQKDVPVDATNIQVLEDTEVPSDRTFRNAWAQGEQGKKIGVHVPTAKLIAHDKRRVKRAQELAPLDIEATIPAKATQAEAARQVIRDKHANIQTAIDACTTPEELKAIVDTEGL
jgi:hypothetical protein